MKTYRHPGEELVNEKCQNTLGNPVAQLSEVGRRNP